MKILLSIIIITLSFKVEAQVFLEASLETILDGVQNGSVAFSDVDGDNDEDVFITGFTTGYSSRLYTNDGEGRFSENTASSFAEVSFSSIAFFDADGDSDEDLIITGRSYPTCVAKLYLNDGDGNFNEAQSSSFIGVSDGSVAYADIDNDADFDLLITGLSDFEGSVTKLYINDGTGNFTENENTPFDGVSKSDILFGDVDSDGDKDVFISGSTFNGIYTAILKLYINDSNGFFIEAENSPFEEMRNGSIALLDLDEDGSLDLLSCGQSNTENATVNTYLNNGFGVFTHVEIFPFEPTLFGDVNTIDIDEDGDQDVFLSGKNGYGISISKLYINEGEGFFDEVDNLAVEGVKYSDSAFADIDGDNDKDLLITGLDDNSGTNRICKFYFNLSVSSSGDNVPEGENNLSYEIFPNPSSNFINIRCSRDFNEESIVKLFDIYGRQMIIQQVEFTGIDKTDVIDISFLKGDLYFLQIENSLGKSMKKILID